MKEISSLMDLHADLDRMFFEHQEALLKRNFPAALERLDNYEKCLLIHMQDEENVLLPIYADRAEILRSATVKMFLDEHEKMRSYVELFREQTAKLSVLESPETDMILLLDREAFYKRLCSHHDKREHQFLYPALDEVTTPEEKAELLGRVTCSFSLSAENAA